MVCAESYNSTAHSQLILQHCSFLSEFSTFRMHVRIPNVHTTAYQLTRILGWCFRSDLYVRRAPADTTLVFQSADINATGMSLARKKPVSRVRPDDPARRHQHSRRPTTSPARYRPSSLIPGPSHTAAYPPPSHKYPQSLFLLSRRP